MRHGESDREGFHEDPADVDALEIIDIEGGDPRPPVQLDLQETLGLQLPDHLAQRRRADPEGPREGELGHHRARRQLTGQDHRAQPLEGGVAARPT